MAAINDSTGNSASPNSSEEIESQQATPATKISPLSPPNDEHKGRGSGIVRANVPPSFILNQSNTNFRSTAEVYSLAIPNPLDPFTSFSNLTASTRSSTGSRLSPIALTFTPSAVPESASSLGPSTAPGSATLQWSDASPLYGPTEVASAQADASTDHASQEKSALTRQDEEVGGTSSHLLIQASSVSKSNYTSKKPQGLMIRPTCIQRSIQCVPANVVLDAKLQLTAPLKTSAFSIEDGTSRGLKFSNGLLASPKALAHELKAVLNMLNLRPVGGLVLADLDFADVVYAKFGDIRDARQAYDSVQQASEGWNISYIEPKLFAAKNSTTDLPVSNFEGQILVKVTPSVLPHILDNINLRKALKEILQEFGEVMALEPENDDGMAIFYRAEYFDTLPVKDALSLLNNRSIGSYVLNTSPYDTRSESPRRQEMIQAPRADMMAQDSVLNKAFGNLTVGGYQDPYGPVTPRNQIFSPYQVPTPSNASFTQPKHLSTRQTPSSTNAYSYGYSSGTSSHSPFFTPTHGRFPEYGLHNLLSPGIIGQERETPQAIRSRDIGQLQQRDSGKMGARQFRDQGHHNVVNVDRIRCGADVRTTIMLRNIPNKIQYPELKEIIDQTCHGKYDFMYLRIDFANNCNVGYAFINFEDPFCIVDFFNDRAGRRWNCYNSDKVAEISYATIQGKDCLVQKFRNSSVMLEHPTFRPKIFYTSNHPMAGEEEEFPLPDNAMKMRRSIENAEHVGLFAPRAGQSYRDEQRRRKSQYDRGTRLAEIEDSYDGGSYNIGYGFMNRQNNFPANSAYGTLSPYSQPGYRHPL